MSALPERAATAARAATPLSVLIVDDHELVRAGIRRILEDFGYALQFSELGSGESLLEVARQQHFDLIFLDLSLPGISGVEAALSLLRRQRDLRIIVVTAVMDVSFTRRLLDSGVRGYITKNCNPRQMERAIREVLADQVYVSPDVAGLLEKTPSSERSQPSFDDLSRREMQIVIELLKGRRNRQIAENLNISEKTVSTHRMRAFRKFGISSTAELASVAMKQGVWEHLTTFNE